MPGFYLRRPKYAVQTARAPHLSPDAVFRLPDVKTRFSALLVAVLAGALVTTALAGGAMIGIYRNGLDSLAQRKQLVKLSGRSCAREAGAGLVKVTVGKRTSACSFRTPVLGRDLEIAATERLLSGTPKALQNAGYLGLELRAGGGAKYELLVFPKQRKTQLIRIVGRETEYLAVARNQSAVVGVNKANVLRLRAVNATTGPDRGQAQISAYVGKTLVGEAVDAAAGDLSGRASTVSFGATKNAKGLVASVEDVVVRVPSPF
jgi:hypothetical protein